MDPNSDTQPKSGMKTKFLTSAAGAVVAAALLFFLPSTFRNRITNSARLLTDPITAAAENPLPSNTAAGNDDFHSMAVRLAETKLELDNLKISTAAMVNENKVLKNRLALAEATRNISLVLCQVIKRDPFTDYYDSVLINRGRNDGIKEGAAVLSEAGLVGTVTEAGRTTSKVTLATSRNFTMPCMVRAKNVQGLIQGEGTRNRNSIAMVQPVPKIVVNNLDGILFDKVTPGDMVTVNITDAADSQVILVGTVESLDSTLPGAPVLHIAPCTSFSQLKYLFAVLPGK